MKTGEGEMDTSAYESAAMDIFLPVLESATVLAAHYSQACGRDTITGQDMRMGLMYAARNIAGKQIGSLYPEIYEEDEEEEEEEEDEDEEEEEFTEYTGTEDDMAVKMNECAATFDAWEPENPSERALKEAVKKSGFSRTDV
jgi:hypothetical protein